MVVTSVAAGGKPGVYAVDLLSGKLVWEQHPTHAYNDPEKGAAMFPSIYSAALSVTNDVVFAASLDGEGKLVDWQYDVWSNTHSTRPEGPAGNLQRRWFWG